MRELSLKQEDNKISGKTHEEIMTIIEEIKTFEERFEEYDIMEPEVKEKSIELEHTPLDHKEPESKPKSSK